MSKDKNKFMPVLRFPEFMKAGEWFECSIDSIGNVVTGGTPSKEDKDFWGGDFVWVTAQDFKEKYIYNSVLKLTQKGKDKSRIIPENSVLVTCIASIGLNGINKVECSTNQQINSIICNSKNHFEFIYYAISQNNNRLKDLAGRTAVPIISKSVFEKFIIHTPETLGEQQKIASCLSSLDEVITAHNQKLSTLKDHKKGLMQNLFPQEGETVPKYRFPEFLEDGDWAEKVLSEVADYENGKAHEKDIDEGGDFVVVNSKFISTEGQTVKYSNSAICLAKNGDILMVLSDLPNGKAIAKCFYVNEDDRYTVNQRICKITPFDCENVFLFYIMNRNSYFLGFDDGVKQTNLRNQDVQNFPFLLPDNPKEQQKIASCLASLDSLISEQGEKIEQLKLHKKGLMQGLFPRVND
jgi:type I restriction enzyme S subunit